MPGMYSDDGKWRVTVVDGLSYVGFYAPDGSINVTGTIIDGTPRGLMAPCGCMYVINNDTETYTGRQTPQGGLYITNTDFNNGAQKVVFVSGSL